MYIRTYVHTYVRMYVAMYVAMYNMWWPYSHQRVGEVRCGGMWMGEVRCGGLLVFTKPL